LPVAGPVRLVIYNILGQQVATLIDGTLSAGQHVMTWNGTSSSGRVVSSGVYFYRLTAGVYTATKKMVMLK
jgi:flagellar hook assembly protein FlgD